MCWGEKGCPQEGREGEMVSPPDRWNQVKMNRGTARKGTRRLGERWTGCSASVMSVYRYHSHPSSFQNGFEAVDKIIKLNIYL